MSKIKKTILQHIEKFKHMAKSKDFVCPHCGDKNLHAQNSDFVDSRGRRNTVTSYTCGGCGFHGTQVEYSVKKNGTQ